MFFEGFTGWHTMIILGVIVIPVGLIWAAVAAIRRAIRGRGAIGPDEAHRLD